MEYKSERVKTIMGAMMEGLNEFNSRRKAGQWKGIILALAEVYPEDRAAMMEEAFSKPEAPRRKTKAKITRRKPATASGRKPNCPDCPPAILGRTGTAAGSNTPAPRVARKGKPETETETGSSAPWQTTDEIIEAFEGSTEAMTAFCQAKNINLPGNIKDPKKIAGYILKHTQQ